MEKIVITGGLGYIGTELCKLYSGVSWRHDITVIDSRFLSERISELKNWNIKFIQGGILDKNLIEIFIKNKNKGDILGPINYYAEKKSIILKISGIWETNNDIGIAFKFLEMYDVQ